MKGLLYILLLRLVTESCAFSCPSLEEGSAYVVHQFECSTYFLCDNSSSRPAFLYRCPTGYHFNRREDTGGCLPKVDSTCEPQIEVTPVQQSRGVNPPPVASIEKYRNYTIHVAHPNNCLHFYKYEGYNNPVLYQCPDEMHFDPLLELCEPKEESSCSSEQNDCDIVPEVECPLDNQQLIHLPHPTDCTAFYKCDWGNPVLFYCPEGTYFNPKINVCDWPRNVPCNRCPSTTPVLDDNTSLLHGNYSRGS